MNGFKSGLSRVVSMDKTPLAHTVQKEKKKRKIRKRKKKKLFVVCVASGNLCVFCATLKCM